MDEEKKKKKKLYVFDFDGTLTDRNVTARGTPIAMLSFRLEQAGLQKSGPLLREALIRIEKEGSLAAIASYGDSRTVSSEKFGGIRTIEYALKNYVAIDREKEKNIKKENEKEEEREKEAENFIEKYLVSLQCFMPSQEYLDEWKKENKREPGAKEADTACQIEEKAGKEMHIERIVQEIEKRFGEKIGKEDVILFDDDQKNQERAREAGHFVVEVDGRDGYDFLKTVAL